MISSSQLRCYPYHRRQYRKRQEERRSSVASKTYYIFNIKIISNSIRLDELNDHTSREQGKNKKITWVVSLAVDVLIDTPTCETKHNQVHNQIQEQQWCCYVSSHCRRHQFPLLPFSTNSILLFRHSKPLFSLIQQKLTNVFGDDDLWKRYVT